MPITITITGENASQAVNELVGYITNLHSALSKLTSGNLPVSAVVGPTVAKTSAESAAAADPVKKDVDKPASETKEEPAKAPAKGKKAAAAPAAPPTQEVTLPEDEEATLDNARAWIQAVNGKLGLDAAAKIITSFGVKKVGEIDASKFEEFIIKCKKALEGDSKPEANNV